jgi:uncharacterized protein (DUF1330 family)
MTAVAETSQPVLVLVEVLEISDPVFMRDYQRAIAPQMARRGAQNLAAGHHTVVGKGDAINMVVSLWPSAAAWTEWQASEEYAPWGKNRDAAARIRTHHIPLLPEVVVSVQTGAS